MTYLAAMVLAGALMLVAASAVSLEKVARSLDTDKDRSGYTLASLVALLRGIYLKSEIQAK